MPVSALDIGVTETEIPRGILLPKGKIMNTPTLKYDLSLQFYKYSEQQIGSYSCISGLVKLSDIFKLFDAMNLEANPRFAKINNVTRDIAESIEKHHELFPLMTNGILLSSTDYRQQERGRFKLNFHDPKIEGVLNGGHNLLAVGAYLLEQATGKKIPSGKNWLEVRKQLNEDTLAIKDFLEDEGNQLYWGRMMPCELIVPTDTSEIGLSQFREQIPLVQAARNNSEALSKQTFANHEGLFDELQAFIDPELDKRIEWKQNLKASIDPRELAAMSWMPISKIDRDYLDDSGKRVEPPKANQVYSSKSVVFDRFVAISKLRDVSTYSDGRYRVKDPIFLSALKITVQLPALYDHVQKLVPAIYNSTAGSRYAGLRTVTSAVKGKKRAITKFYGEELALPVHDALVWPIFYSLRELITQGEDGLLVWETDPHDFIDAHFEEYGETFKEQLEAVGGDPGAYGKMPAIYGSFVNLTRMLKAQHLN